MEYDRFHEEIRLHLLDHSQVENIQPFLQKVFKPIRCQYSEPIRVHKIGRRMASIVKTGLNCPEIHQTRTVHLQAVLQLQQQLKVQSIFAILATIL